MDTRSSFAPGKIIFSGEYAVLFGKPGIAVPSKQELHVTWKEGRGATDLKISSTDELLHPLWLTYAQRVIRLCEKKAQKRFVGTLEIDNSIPLGKGMGSSSALVIAVARCLLGENCETQALEIEGKVNPGHSGIDFAVIWNNVPLVFQKGKKPHPLPATRYPLSATKYSLLDTGVPNEPTPELIAWVKSRSSEPDVAAALETIGTCTERLLAGESPMTVLPDHHRAQVALGVVPEDVQTIIADIEKSGGAAKIIGAGGRTGGGGMVLVIK